MKSENSSEDIAAQGCATGGAGFCFWKGHFRFSDFKKALVFLCLLGTGRADRIFRGALAQPFLRRGRRLTKNISDTVGEDVSSRGEDLHELHGFQTAALSDIPRGALQTRRLARSGTGRARAASSRRGDRRESWALLGARLFRHRLSGVVGGSLFFLLAPVPLYFEGELLIESSYIFLICAGLLAPLCARRKLTDGKRRAALAVLRRALMVLASQARARTSLFFFLAVYPLFAAWSWWRFAPSGAALGWPFAWTGPERSR